MILTVTLNPAVDKTCNISRLILGEVNRLHTSLAVAGGKGVNVSKVLRTFHLPVMATGFLGGYAGKMIEDALEGMGVECRFVKTEGETRTNTNIIGEDGYVTEVLEPGPVISDKEFNNFFKAFTDCLEICDMVVLSGSLPQGVPVDIYEKLTGICNMLGRKVFLDTSGEALKKGIEAKPYFIKPNHKEMEFLVGKKLSSEEEIIEEAKKLVEGGIKKVVVSLGAKGLIYVDEEQVLIEEAKKVKVKNTVGCGDSVVAAYVMSEEAGDDARMAMQKALAISAANATTEESANIPIHTYLDLL